MSCRKLLMTNNPVHGRSFALRICGRRYAVGSAQGQRSSWGWVLLSHPLYGNLRPTSTLQICPGGASCCGSRPHVDLQSLEYIENALGIYLAEKDRILSDRDLPGGVKDDFAFIDAELMKESLSRYRMMPGDGFNKVAERR